jgi:hypothetical protein
MAGITRLGHEERVGRWQGRVQGAHVKFLVLGFARSGQHDAYRRTCGVEAVRSGTLVPSCWSGTLLFAKP